MIESEAELHHHKLVTLESIKAKLTVDSAIIDVVPDSIIDAKILSLLI